MRVSTKETIYFLEDASFRSYAWDGYKAVLAEEPAPISQNPDGWKQIQTRFGTSFKYWSMLRSFTVPLKFVNDGANIIRWFNRHKGGFEAELYVKIMRWNRDTGIHELEYRGRLDFKKYHDMPIGGGVEIYSIEGGIYTLFNSNEAQPYEIPCNETNPAAIKVLFDGMDFKETSKYQGIDSSSDNYQFVIPITFVSREGDSFGVVTGDQQLVEYNTDPEIIDAKTNYLFYSTRQVNGVVIKGTLIMDKVDNIVTTNQSVYFITSLGTRYYIFQDLPMGFGPARFEYPFIKTIDLAPNEQLFLVSTRINALGNARLLFKDTAFTLTYYTKVPESTCYGLRGIDLLKQLVSKMTDGKYTAESVHLTNNNRVVLTSGTALRKLDNAVIITSFFDLFTSFDPDDDLGVRMVNNVLYLEPKKVLYADTSAIFDLGEVAEVEIVCAEEHLASSVKIGAPIQTYNNSSNGRLEFNSTWEWKLPVSTLSKEINFVTKYREDPYGIEALRAMIGDKENTDNVGDNAVFKVVISNDQDVDGNYLLSRPAYSSLLPLVLPANVYNTELSPKRKLLGKGSYIRSMLYQLQGEKIKFSTGDKNKDLQTTLDGVTIRELENVTVGSMAAPYFIPYFIKFKTMTTYLFNYIMTNLNSAGTVRLNCKGHDVHCLPVGDMSAMNSTQEPQEWRLLLSANNNLDILLLLSQNALFIKDFNNNMLSISNLNPLHFVKYNFSLHAKYHIKEIYDDFFENRTNRFPVHPDYAQPFQTTDAVRLQFRTAGLGQLNIKIYNSKTNLVNTVYMEIQANPAIQSPFVLQKLDIDLVDYPVGLYTFIVCTGGTPLAIAEYIEVGVDFPETVLIEYFNSYNLQNGFFSTWRPMLRVEGMLMPWMPKSSFTEYEDDSKDPDIVHQVPSKVRPFMIGNARGIPDWMALKVDEILLLNRVYIENNRYVRSADSKFEGNKVPGWPMNYYTTELQKAINDSSLTIDDSNLDQEPVNSVLTLDAIAFGKADGVIEITIEKE